MMVNKPLINMAIFPGDGGSIMGGTLKFRWTYKEMALEITERSTLIRMNIIYAKPSIAMSSKEYRWIVWIRFRISRPQRPLCGVMVYQDKHLWYSMIVLEDGFRNIKGSNGEEL